MENSHLLVILTYASIRKLTPQEKSRFPAYKYVTLSESKYKYGNEEVIVPAGFLTDGSTGGPDFGRSWLFHDYLYATHKFASGEPCTRHQADKVMERILRTDRFSLYLWIFHKLARLNPFGLFAKAWRTSGKRGPQFI